MSTAEALFVGLCTLDILQLVDHVPVENEKLTARRQTVAAGGPATNAAVTCAYLGSGTTLVTGVGRHPLTAGIRADLAEHRVRLIDLAEERDASPTVSSIFVTEATGTRTVVSTNAVTDRLYPHAGLGDLVRAADIVQVDGHHPDLAIEALRLAREHGRRTVLDAGSWKPGTEELLGLLDVVACSADFRVPGDAPVAPYLLGLGVPWVAVTRGGEPIHWWSGSGRSGVVAVAPGTIVDTLGAGDVFHGALTHALAGGRLDADRFTDALARAAAVATRSCGSFGTRAWLAEPA